MILLPTILALQAASPSHLTAARAPSPPAIDGRLDEATWQKAKPSGAFTQKSPAEGKPPVERTLVRVLYDNNAVYVGIECEQTKAPVVARLTRRDRYVEADSVTIALDTLGDKKTAYEFTVNAADVLSDGKYSNDTEFSSDWDEIWDARTSITARGWSAEIRIPLHALRYETKPEQRWGFQVRRYVSARQETDEWSFTPKSQAGVVSHFGLLDGIKGLRARNYVEIVPFVAASLRHRDVPPEEEDPGISPRLSAGTDLRWHVTPQLTLNATVNPDFAQVEADPAVLNLGTFENFFPEKRPFFLEGADLFNTPLSLVYTRRIGRAPDAPALLEEAPYGEVLVEDPEPATIYGAEKLVGDLGGKVSVGELVAITARQRVEARRLDGSSAMRVADPLTTFKVLRVRRGIGEGGQIGAIAMATNRYEPEGQYPTAPALPGEPRRLRCPGGEDVLAGSRCFHDAYVAGADARWRSPSGDYVAAGQLIGTLIQDGPPRTMPDGTVIASGDASPAGTARVAKEGGNFRWEASYQGHGRRVDYNDLGYMQRQNVHSAYAHIRYVTTKPRWTTLQTTTTLGVEEQDTPDLLNLRRAAFIDSEWQLKNFWWLYMNAHAGLDRYDDREVGDGTALQRPGWAGASAYIGTDPRERLRFEAFSFFDVSLHDGFTSYGEVYLTIKVLPQLDVTLAPTWLYGVGDRRYFGTEGGVHLFGTQRAQSFSLTLRSTYTFTPHLTLEAYAQAFLASEAYTDYADFPVSAGGPGRRVDLDALRPRIVVPETDPDYESATFNVNLVMRWEYRVGSTLYIVYTHGQSDSLTPSRRGTGGLNFSLLEPRPAADVLLAKLSYWWG